MKKSSLPKSSLKIGVVQMTSVQDVEANLQMVREGLETLRDQKCDMICLPENTLYFRIQKKPATKVSFNLREKFWAEFQEYSRREKCHLIFGSIPYSSAKKAGATGKVSNATVVISLGQKPKVKYEKIHLFDVDVKGAPPVRESDVFYRGKKPHVLKINGWNVGLSICYDMRFADLYSYYAKQNAHLILVPSAFLVPTGQAHWHVLLRARAIESQAYIVAAAQSGGHVLGADRRETFGHSLVIGPWGEVIGDLGEGYKTATFELSPSNLEKVRAQIPMVNHRRKI